MTRIASLALVVVALASFRIAGQAPVYFSADERNIAVPLLGVQEARTFNDGDAVLVSQLWWPPTGRALPLSWFQNDGRGGFSNATHQIVGSAETEHPRQVLVTDVNGDGREDVFIADHGIDTPPFPGGQSRLLIQRADGRLVDETASRLPAVRAFTHNVAAGDVDGDGDVDLYLCNIHGAGNIGPKIYLNDGTGRFSPTASGIPAPIASLERRFTAAALVDVDRDDDVDLVLGAHPGTNEPRDLILLNDGQGRFSYAPDAAMPPRHGNADWGTVSIVSADVNNDSWPDLLLTSVSKDYRQTAVQVLLNQASGAQTASLGASKKYLFGFQDQVRSFRDVSDGLDQHWKPGDEQVWAKWIIPADLNGDGWVDLIVQVSGGFPRLFVNRGDARFADASSILPRPRSGQSSADAVAVGDFDHDGRTDLFVLFGSTQMFARNVRPFRPLSGCNIDVGKGSRAVVNMGGVLTVPFSAPDGCAWTVASTIDWLRVLSPDTGTGSGEVLVVATPNVSTVPRTGLVRINGRQVVVRQAGAGR